MIRIFLLGLLVGCPWIVLADEGGCGEVNERYEQVLACSSAVQGLYQNDQGEINGSNLANLFRGIQPALNRHEVTCPQGQQQVFGRNVAAHAKMPLSLSYTLATIRPVGGYYLLDIYQKNEGGCLKLKARQTKYKNESNPTGPVTIPYRTVQCRSPEGVESLSVSLPIEQYYETGKANDWYVKSKNLQVGENSESRYVLSTEELEINTPKVSNFIFSDLNYSATRLLESVRSKDETNQTYWRSSAHRNQLKEVVENCRLKPVQEALKKDSPMAVRFFSKINEIEIALAQKTPIGPTTRPRIKGTGGKGATGAK